MTTNTNKFFDSKDQYLAFRAAFAAAVNDPRAKKGKPMPPYGNRDNGWMTASHFMLLNAVRGLPLTRGFAPVTNTVKLANGMPAEFNINNAKATLNSAINNAKSFIENKPAELSSWEIPRGIVGNLQSALDAKTKLIEEKTAKRQLATKARLDAFLEPFAGTLSITDLARLPV